MSKKNKKQISVIQWENGFVNPIKIFPGPQGGAYMPMELQMVFDDLSGEDMDVVIYEVKAVKTTTLKQMKEDDGATNL